MILILTGCLLIVPESPTYPIHTVECTHEQSIYEANLYIEAQDLFDWDAIAVNIEQGENTWSAGLREVEDNIWEIEMNLMELDCTADYDVGLYYFTYQ